MIKTGGLGNYGNTYGNLSVIEILIRVATGYYLAKNRFYRDIFDKNLALFHIKEFLVVQTLVAMLDIVESISKTKIIKLGNLQSNTIALINSYNSEENL